MCKVSSHSVQPAVKRNISAQMNEQMNRLTDKDQNE